MSFESSPKVYLYRRIVQAKLFIDDNYHWKIEVSNISDEAYFSKFHFIRLFKSIYGHTPHQYLTLVRLQKAKQLLRKQESVASTCFAVGFDSITSFTNLFKRRIGMPPSTFLAAQTKLNSEKSKKPFVFIPSCYALQNGWNENSNFQEVEEKEIKEL